MVRSYLFTADAGVGAGQKRPPRLSYSACSGPGGSRFANWGERASIGVVHQGNVMELSHRSVSREWRASRSTGHRGWRAARIFSIGPTTTVTIAAGSRYFCAIAFTWSPVTACTDAGQFSNRSTPPRRTGFDGISRARLTGTIQRFLPSAQNENSLGPLDLLIGDGIGRRMNPAHFLEAEFDERRHRFLAAASPDME